MKKLMTWIIAALLLAEFAYSVQPGTTTNNYYNIIQQSNEGVIVEFPKNIYFKQDSPFELEFHIFNSSNYILNDTQVSCIIHVYNYTGEHMIEDNLSMDDNGIDFYYEMNAIDENGIYPYIVQCNSANEAGFTSTSFIITSDGKAPESNSGLMAMIVLIPLILGILSCFGAATLGTEHNLFKFVMFVFSFICVFSSLSIGITAIIHFYNFTAMEDYLTGTMQWMVIFFGMIISYFIIYFLYTLFKALGDKKREKVNY